MTHDDATFSDAQLLIRWRDDRDEGAFQLLVERHGPLVWRVARSHCRDPHLSEDVFQQAFSALARHAGRIKPGPLAPWLHTTTWRAARDLLRQAWNQPSSCAETEHVMDEADAPELGREEVVMAVDRALASLPEHLRALALLHGLQGIPLRQCAEQLGHPSGSVSGLWAQARRRLQRHLRQFGALELSLVANLWQEATAASGPSSEQVDRAIASAAGLPPPPSIPSSLSLWTTIALTVLGTIVGAVLWWRPHDAVADGQQTAAGHTPTNRPADHRQWNIEAAIDFSVATDDAGRSIITLRKRVPSPRRAQARWLPPRRERSFTVSYRYWSASLDEVVPPCDQWPHRHLHFAYQSDGYVVTSTDAGEVQAGWISHAQFADDDPLAWTIIGQGEIHLADLSLEP